MTIIRTIHGEEVSIELTPDEMYKAYYEQQFNFDCEDVRSHLDGFDDAWLQVRYGFSRKQLEQLVEDIANEERTMIDSWDLDWLTAIEEATDEVVQRAHEHGWVFDEEDEEGEDDLL